MGFAWKGMENNVGVSTNLSCLSCGILETGTDCRTYILLRKMCLASVKAGYF